LIFLQTHLQEWSLWTRDIEADIVPTCRELGIKIVAYSPLGRGFLTNTIRSTGELDPSDYRVYGQPRFGEQNMAQNLALVDAAAAVAAKKGCTPGQLALAFLHAHGPDVIPIPGTSSLAHLQVCVCVFLLCFWPRCFWVVCLMTPLFLCRRIWTPAASR